jgi:hypothetical protein
MRIRHDHKCQNLEKKSVFKPHINCENINCENINCENINCENISVILSK